MNTALKSFVLLLLAVAVALPLCAADKEKKAEGKKKAAKKAGARAGGGQIVNAVLKRLGAAELTDEQTAKIKEIGKEFAPKLAAARQKMGLTKEQQAAQKEARQKAQADGLKGKALREAVENALNLSDDQKAARAEVQKLTAELNQAALAVLTDEQKAKVAPKRGAKKNAGKKKAKKKVEADK